MEVFVRKVNCIRLFLSMLFILQARWVRLEGESATEWETGRFHCGSIPPLLDPLDRPLNTSYQLQPTPPKPSHCPVFTALCYHLLPIPLLPPSALSFPLLAPSPFIPPNPTLLNRPFPPHHYNFSFGASVLNIFFKELILQPISQIALAQHRVWQNGHSGF